MVVQDGIPDPHAVVEIADVPQKIGPVRCQPGGDDVGVKRFRVVLDDIDDVDALRLRELLFPAPDRPAIDIVDANDDRARGRHLVFRQQNVVGERHGHATQGAPRRDGSENIVAVRRDGISDRAGLPVDGLELLGAR